LISSGPDEKSVYLDANTRIQIVDTMMMLPHAEKEQNAAFIVSNYDVIDLFFFSNLNHIQRDERVLVVWADGPDTIIPTCNDFEERLIKLLWRARPGFGTSPTPSGLGSCADSVSIAARVSTPPSETRVPIGRSTPGADATREDVEKANTKASSAPRVVRTVKRRWYGKRVVEEKQYLDPGDEPELGYGPEKRPALLYAPLYNGMAAGLSLGEYHRFEQTQ
jgi:hypothetical protein